MIFFSHLIVKICKAYKYRLCTIVDLLKNLKAIYDIKYTR